VGKAKTVLYGGSEPMNVKAAEFPKILSMKYGENTHLTPDFRFVEYSYQRPDWSGPHRPRTLASTQTDCNHDVRFRTDNSLEMTASTFPTGCRAWGADLCRLRTRKTSRLAS
jgi:hypothetical protein